MKKSQARDHAKKLREALTNADNEMSDARKLIAQKATDELKKKYVGKIIKCRCFDAWSDGDDYYFEGELLDICVCYHESIYLTATFKYGDDDKPTELYLDTYHPFEVK